VRKSARMQGSFSDRGGRAPTAGGVQKTAVTGARLVRGLVRGPSVGPAGPAHLLASASLVRTAVTAR